MVAAIRAGEVSPEVFFENYILTVKEAARLLKFSTKTVYAMVSRGELPCKKTSKGIRFLLPELIGWMKGE
ncbi:MAG: helix-turn-helix domain-containing protein [Bacteriovoracia bacterium]